MTIPTVILLLVLLLGAVTGAMIFGTRRWALQTRLMRSRIRAALDPIDPPTVRHDDLAALPAPVQRYLRAVLADGQSVISEARFRHRGTFNVGRKTDKWKTFTSDQLVVTRRPGFDWHGRIGPMRVHDAYIEGEGVLRASLYGVVNLVNMRDGGDLAQGELMRFLAEAVLYPTVLLPGQGVQWEAVDDHSARAIGTDGAHQVSLLFTFGEDGLVETVHAEARGRLERGTFEPTPWQGRFWNYAERGGMRVPLEGEVAWIRNGEAKPYWRGTLSEIEYELERANE